MLKSTGDQYVSHFGIRSVDSSASCLSLNRPFESSSTKSKPSVPAVSSAMPMPPMFWIDGVTLPNRPL